MKKRILPLLLLGGAIAGTMAVLTSCGDSIDSLTGSNQVVTDASGRVAFSEVQPILTQKCEQCHADDNYTDSAVLAQGAGTFVTAISSGAMPAPGAAPLSAVQKATLLSWLQGLAPAAAPPQPIVDAAGRVEFSQVLLITREKCAICHGGYTDSAKLSSSAASVENAVQIDYMPLAGSTPLTPVEKATLVTWLKQEQGL